MDIVLNSFLLFMINFSSKKGTTGMRNKVLFYFFLLMPSLILSAQVKSEDAKRYEEQYKNNIQKTYINDVYIPKDMAEAFSQLDRLIDSDSRKKYKQLEETEAAEKLFFSFGRWMIIKWNFYEGSRFSHYLKGVGLSHPDDMAVFVMIMYHRHLNREKLDVKNLVELILSGKWRENPLQESN